MYIMSKRTQESSVGELREQNVQVNELPPVGSYVIVCAYSYDHAPSSHKRAKYKPLVSSSTFYDGVKERPRVFRVESYSNGVENVLDTNNKITLISKVNESYCIRTTIMAIHVVTGSMKLELIDEHE